MDLRYEGNLPALYFHGFKELLGKFAIPLFPWLEYCLRYPKNRSLTLLLLLPGFSLVIFFVLQALKAFREKEFSLIGIYCGIYILLLPFGVFMVLILDY